MQETIGRDLPGDIAAQQSSLPPQLADELDKALSRGNAEPAPDLHVPFVDAGAPAPAARAEPVPAADPVVAGQAAGSTSVSPEQSHPAPANDSEPAAHQPMQETTMASNFDYSRTAETMQTAAQNTAQQMQAGMTQAAETVRKQTEDFTRQGQQAWSQATDRTKDAMDKGMKAFEDFNSHARGNADAWMASSRAAAQGIEQIVQQTAEFTRKAFESATNAMRTMASARTPQDVMQAQNDFAKAQFDNMVGEFSRMTETMMKVASSVVEPVQSSMTETAAKATDTVKGIMATSANNAR